MLPNYRDLHNLRLARVDSSLRKIIDTRRGLRPTMVLLKALPLGTQLVKRKYRGNLFTVIGKLLQEII